MIKHKQCNVVEARRPAKRLCSPHAPREVSGISQKRYPLGKFRDPHAEREGYIGASPRDTTTKQRARLGAFLILFSGMTGCGQPPAAKVDDTKATPATLAVVQPKR